jgi:hypothetical protein
MTAVRRGVPLIMSMSAAEVYLDALRTWRDGAILSVKTLQEYHAGLSNAKKPDSDPQLYILDALKVI